MKLTVAVIYGSVRPQRQGIKAARFIVRSLQERGHEVFFVDPMEYSFPLLALRYKDYAPGEAPLVIEQVHTILNEADAVVVVSGEYNHSIPPALKNILDHYGPEFLHKAGGIVTYSSGPFGGVRVLSSVREILAELGCSVIPSPMAVPSVGEQFSDDGTPKDVAFWNPRAEKFLSQLEWHTEALKAKRELGSP